MTTVVVAAGTIDAVVVVEAARPDAPAAPDHDSATGEIYDRERHHHWDTV